MDKVLPPRKLVKNRFKKYGPTDLSIKASHRIKLPKIEVEKPATIKLKEEIIQKIKDLELDEQLSPEGVRKLVLECINE